MPASRDTLTPDDTRRVYTSIGHGAEEVAVEQRTAARPRMNDVLAGIERGIGRYTRFERVLALFLIFAPVLLILSDENTVRESISAYYDMTEAQIFYVPLTAAAMLFVVNSLVRREHPYNLVLGILLAGVVLFDHDDWTVLHSISAISFFVGNVAVIAMFSQGPSRRAKTVFLAAIATAVALWQLFDWPSLFVVEWVSLAIIAVHYVLDSIDDRRVPYSAAPGPPPARATR